MNTKQIMSIIEEWGSSRECDGLNDEYNSKETADQHRAMKAAVTTLVQERHERGVLAIANGIKAESLVQERDALQNEVYARNGDVVNLMSERDAITLDLHTERCALVAMQAERDRLTAENKVLRDALQAQADPPINYAAKLDKKAAENKALRDRTIILDTHNTMLRVCLKNVIKVADRKTDEFDAAKAALEKS
jgi:hypothetical protein